MSAGKRSNPRFDPEEIPVLTVRVPSRALPNQPKGCHHNLRPTNIAFNQRMTKVPRKQFVRQVALGSKKNCQTNRQVAPKVTSADKIEILPAKRSRKKTWRILEAEENKENNSEVKDSKLECLRPEDVDENVTKTLPKLPVDNNLKPDEIEENVTKPKVPEATNAYEVREKESTDGVDEDQLQVSKNMLQPEDEVWLPQEEAEPVNEISNIEKSSSEKTRRNRKKSLRALEAMTFQAISDVLDEEEKFQENVQDCQIMNLKSQRRQTMAEKLEANRALREKVGRRKFRPAKSILKYAKKRSLTFQLKKFAKKPVQKAQSKRHRSFVVPRMIPDYAMPVVEDLSRSVVKRVDLEMKIEQVKLGHLRD